MSRQLHRKRLRAKPSSDALLNYVVYLFTFATPLFELPQAIEIYTHHSAHDVSPWTWGFFCLDNLVWFIYATRKRILPLALTSVLYEIIELTILVGALAYR